MKFEHMIDVNAPDAGGDTPLPLSRDQVWQGLWLRVWCPQRLPNGPSACECVMDESSNESTQLLKRQLQFGALAFHDTVTITPETQVQFKPKAHDETAPIGLTITLSEPVPGQPRLSFCYEALSPLSEEEALYSGYRQNAWLHADHDMVGTWRLWLAQGVWPVSGV